MNYVSGHSGKPSLILAALRSGGRCMDGCKLEVDRAGERPINSMIGNFLRHGHIACVALVFVVGLMSEAIADDTPDFRTVALTGTDGPRGPGLGADVEFGYLQGFRDLFSFDPPVINEAGQVAFMGFLNAEGVLDSPFTRGIWSEGEGSGLEVVALEGEPAPGADAGVSFGSIRDNRTVINNAGQIVFSAQVLSTQDGLSETGIWVTDADGLLKLVALGGNSAPGTGDPEIVFRGIGSPNLNDAGQVAFRSRLRGPGVNNLNIAGIWLADDESGLQLLERKGNPVFGDSFFSQVRPPVLNDMGQIVFSGRARGPSTSDPQFEGYWSVESGTGHELVVVSGTPAPGAGSGVTFRDFPGSQLGGLNNAGQVAFLASVTGGDIVDFVNDRGIWSDGGGSGLDLVALEGNPAPGADPGENFGTLSSPVLNGAGQVAFWGRIEDPDRPDRPAIWSNVGGSGLELIAQQGDAAPGTDRNFVAFDVNPMINGMGQVAFRAFFDGPGLNNQGIWATDVNGQLQLIVRTGILFDVSNDPSIEDLRTVRSVSMVTDNSSAPASGNEDSRRSSFNDSGQIAFKLEFSSKQGVSDDSAGIFVSNVVAVAEPDLQPSRSHIDFSDVSPGQSSTMEMLFIDNAGDGSLEIGTIITEGPAAADIQIAPSDDQCSLEIVDPDGTCGIGIRFVPQTPGIRTADLRIPSNDPGGPEVIELQGTSDVVFFNGFE